MSTSRPFLPYGRQNITEADIAEVMAIMQSPYLTQGPAVPIFEETVADAVEAQYGVAVNSATSALHIACLALGLGSGDRLWTSPITFVASANCGRYCGASIDFVDIDAGTGLMCTSALERKLKVAKEKNELPKIVIPVHLAGTSCEMEKIYNLSRQYGFKIIEDASHAIGGLYKNRKVGCCEYSEIAIFSFHPVKIITTGEGGIAVTNNKDIAERMRDLRSHGITKDKSKFKFKQEGDWCYEQHILGFNYRMTDIQAALGTSQLRRLEEIVDERNRQLQYYKKRLTCDSISFLRINDSVRSSVHLGVILTGGKNGDLRNELYSTLKKNKIGSQVHYMPVHLQPYYRKLGFKEGDFPNAEEYAKKALSIPLFPGLEVQERDRITRIIQETIGNKSKSGD